MVERCPQRATNVVCTLPKVVFQFLCLDALVEASFMEATSHTVSAGFSVRAGAIN